ncbi:hypothetical protein SAY86_026026 [Trapa natans]|uniref:Uncharacterized protein n=1 Tax=Trapa natans TaxID=22666 RepID=A0AAN7KDI6_TRANT|nr:hypothetical protein SAY86_026026 [Trapa natans]
MEKLEDYVQGFDAESSDSDHHGMGALEILRETVRILRYNLSSFMAIAAFLICPLCALLLPNFLVDQSLPRRLSDRLMLLARSSGIPLVPFVSKSCQKFSETVISSAICFPLYVTLLLLAKAAVAYAVDCTYSRKKAHSSKFFMLIMKIWGRVLSTYLWACMVIVGCVIFFLVILVGVSTTFSALGSSDDFQLYMAVFEGLVFSVAFANAVIICNMAVVISVLEDISGLGALLRSSNLIKGRTQVGLMIFLGSTIGMAFIEGLFEHRVKNLSYGDGSSRLWEGPLLVVMYSFLVLIDFMMTAVFYFSCKSCRTDAPGGELHSIVDSTALSNEAVPIPIQPQMSEEFRHNQ